MGPDTAIHLLRDAMVLALVAGGPLFFALLVTGLLVGIFQAATQINDTAVGFIPRILVCAAVLWLLGGWMAERFAGNLAEQIARMGTF